MQVARWLKVSASTGAIVLGTMAPVRLDVSGSGTACGIGVRLTGNTASATECPCGGVCQYVQFFTSCCTANFRCYYPA